MQEFIFSDAVRPQPVVILRLPLLTYSLGHEILLLRARNAVLTHSVAQFNQLTIAQQVFALTSGVLICAKDWAGSQKPEKYLRLWHWLNRNTNWPLQIAEFRNYLAAAHAGMESPDERSDEVCAEAGGYEPMAKARGRSFGSPLVARLLNFVSQDQLFAAHGCKTPYDFNYSLALNLYLTDLETQGNVRIQNREEREEKSNYEKIVAEFRAEEEKQAQKPKKPEQTEQNPLPKASGLASEPPDLNAEKPPRPGLKSETNGGDHA